VAARSSRPAAIATAGLLLVLLSLGVWAFAIEPARLIVTRSTIALPGWPKDLPALTVAIVSDLHTGAPYVGPDKLDLIVALTNGQEPDLIVLLGDFVTHGVIGGRTVEPEVTAAKLRGLRAPLGVYAVLGNHDWWYDGRRVGQALRAAGIIVLENETVRLQHGGKPLWLAGLADLMTRGANPIGTIAAVPEPEPIIVLTHNPDIFPFIPRRVTITLAGHTHGGQVNLPFVGRPIVPSMYGQRYAAGHVVEDGRHLFVTTGIATSILPVRFRVPPEIAVVTLKAG
jgi:predicted MPP superfamily phosphohydrolase